MKPIRKIRTRWRKAGDYRWDDFFFRVPRWLRIKRFLHEDRTEYQLRMQALRDCQEDEYDGGDE